MRIAIIGAGNMGSWMVESLCLDYEVGVFDTDRTKMRYFFNSRKFLYLEEILDFSPDLLINAVSLDKTLPVFDEIISYLPKDCIIADITSVKTGLAEYYQKLGRRFVSTHPMFGPTFANVRDLRDESAIIISESDEEGKEIFRKFYKSLNINIFEYSFKEHDETIAYSLSIPFASTMVFASIMKEQEAPGTTFKKHLNIAEGLLSEDDYLLSEILLSPHSLNQVERISQELNSLTRMLKSGDKAQLKKFFANLRSNIGLKPQD
ncbi:MAG: prephenate dehydrogenase/arogenate dehydrogenase family protein [Bacteroides sp.]|nr:prephenate dehydrogenase/arogenate dehydrogenase family protein [Bacteroides sp.]